MKKALAFLVLGVLIAAGCSSQKKASKINLQQLYGSAQQYGEQPQFYIFHHNQDSSRLFFRIANETLLYVKSIGSEKFDANVVVSYRLYQSYESKLLLDSGSVWIKDIKKNINEDYLDGSIDFMSNFNVQDGRMVLFVSVSDMNRNHSFVNLLNIERSGPFAPQNYLARHLDGTPLFKKHLDIDEPFTLEFNQPLSQFTVRYYEKKSEMAPPPYVDFNPSTETYKPDSTFVWNATDTFSVSNPGIYQFLASATQGDGITLFHFNETFPYVGLKNQLPTPLRFLTTNEEFIKMTAPEDPSEKKKAVDQFWFALAGSPDKTRYLVKEYYTRVENANRYFTSYQEGWKTDRGLIYVVYGPPTNIYRNIGGEVWVYGNENSSLRHVYTFLRVENSFSDNDYALIRQSNYRYGWGRAIEAWRNGIPYSIKEIKREQDERDQSFRGGSPYFWY